MTDRVSRALRHSVALKAGTPLEMASTPVIALQPSANARIRSSSVSDSTAPFSVATPVTVAGHQG